MKCTILNRNYPPGAGITGQSANELAGYLELNGVSVRVITTGAQYNGGGALDNKRHGEVISLGTPYSGKQKHLRLLATIYDGFRLARKAFQEEYGPIICMTDPPLLPFWVSQMARKNKVSWIYWSMDLFPEAFVADRLCSSNNRFYRVLYSGIRVSAPSALLALGRNQAKFIKANWGQIEQTILLPCGISDSAKASESPDWRKDSHKVYLGYIGNLGSAHDADFVIEAMRAIDPDRHHFILVAYGVQSQRVLHAARCLDGVTILDRVQRGHLSYVDVHLATLLPKWDHLCVPSKAVSAVCEGSALILNCSEENDSWILLKEAAWRVEPGAEKKTIYSIIRGVSNNSVESKKRAALSIRKKLFNLKHEAFCAVLDLIKIS